MELTKAPKETTMMYVELEMLGVFLRKRIDGTMSVTVSGKTLTDITKTLVGKEASNDN